MGQFINGRFISIDFLSISIGIIGLEMDLASFQVYKNVDKNLSHSVAIRSLEIFKFLLTRRIGLFSRLIQF